MKREILFKARRIDTGEWVEGDLIHGFGRKYGRMFILPLTNIYPKGCNELDGWEVDTKTVSQFINKIDKNGKKIFEGDFDNDGNCVVWCDNCNGFEFAQLDVPTKDIWIPCHRCDGNFFFGDHINNFEIVGNVAD